MAYCNHCRVQELKRLHGQDHVTTGPSKSGFSGGVDVFVDGHWVMWCMELPEKCIDVDFSDIMKWHAERPIE